MYLKAFAQSDICHSCLHFIVKANRMPLWSSTCYNSAILKALQGEKMEYSANSSKIYTSSDLHGTSTLTCGPMWHFGTLGSSVSSEAMYSNPRKVWGFFCRRLTLCSCSNVTGFFLQDIGLSFYSRGSRFENWLRSENRISSINSPL